MLAVVEKPPVDQAPSNLAVVGRYVLSSAIWDLLEKTPAGAGNEIQLTDTIGMLMESETVEAFHIQGCSHDCGNKQAGHERQATWRFEMRDSEQPGVKLGNELQLDIVELKKADRLGLAPAPLKAWITFIEHWQEASAMANVEYEPVKKAMSKLKTLSADEEARRLAFVRERALRDEASLMNQAREEGMHQGMHQGMQQGMHQGIEGTLRKLIQLKFGSLPEWVDERLAAGTDEQLDLWVTQMLSAESLEELFREG